MKTRELEKRLGQLEAAAKSARTRPSLRRGPRMTTQEAREIGERLEQELYEWADEQLKEYKQLIATPEHKRMVLLPSVEGHKYRQAFYREYVAVRLRLQLQEEYPELDWRNRKQAERERVAATKAAAEERRLKRETKVDNPGVVEPVVVGWSDD